MRASMSDIVEIPLALAQMREVSLYPGDEYRDGANPTENLLRDLHRDKPGEFLARFDRLEREYLKAISDTERRLEGQKPDKEEVQQADLGSDRAVQAARQLLRDMAEKTAEDAEAR
jgi:hypothetical protein